MTNIKNEMTDEMLDAVTGGAGFYMIEPGKNQGTFNILVIEGAVDKAQLVGKRFSELKASFNVDLKLGLHGAKLENFKKRMSDRGIELLN